MKNLKFKHDFVKEILEGRKNTTWRLFDDKNLSVGDDLNLMDAEDGKKFATAKIVLLREKSIKDLTEEELKDHKYDDREKMINSHRKYYGDKVDIDTIVKIITFNVL